MYKNIVALLIGLFIGIIIIKHYNNRTIVY